MQLKQKELQIKVKQDGEIPPVTEETLQLYHDYLIKNLSFPFDAKYSQEKGPLEITYNDIK